MNHYMNIFLEITYEYFFLLDSEIIREFQVREDGELLHVRTPDSQTASTTKKQAIVESE